MPILGKLGRFELRAVLGEGGMGCVYRAFDTKLKREVALKVIRAHLAGSAEQRAGLIAEAQAAAQLEHPHIVPVFEANEIEDTPYLVMPLLSGESLADRLKRGPLAIHTACRIASQIADGLAVAHAAGLVHRDIKPGNIWLESTNRGNAVRILDFGLARPLTGTAKELAGTPAYMAPEQAGQKVTDDRADLFALGVVLFEMLTGNRLFPAQPVRQLLEVVKAYDSPPAAQLLPAIPPSVGTLVTGLLRNDPAKRKPATARETADKFAEFAERYDPGTRRRRLRQLVGTAALVLGSGLGVLGVVQLKRHLIDSPISLQRRAPHLAASDQPKPGGVPVREHEKPIPIADVVGKPLASLDHLDRSEVSEKVLKDAGDGDPARVAPEIVAILARSGLADDGHEGDVNAVALHPNGALLATGGTDHTVRLWNLATNPPKQLAVLPQNVSSVRALTFTADGKRLVSGADNGNIFVWELDGQKLTKRYENTKESVLALAPAKSGSRVAVGHAEGVAKVLDLDAKEEGLTNYGSRNSTRGVAFLDGDKKLLVGSNGFLRLVTLAENKELANLTESKVWFSALAVSPDGTKVLANGIGYVVGQRPTALGGIFGGFGNNHDLARQNSVSVRDVTKELATLRVLRHEGRVAKAAFTPDGKRVVTVTDDSRVHLWDWSAEQRLASATLVHEGAESHILCRDLAVHPDGRHAIVCRSNGHVYVVRLMRKE